MNFVATKRAKWTISKFSAICSEHFVPDDYEKSLVEIPGTRDYTPRLKKLSIRPNSKEAILQTKPRHATSVRYVYYFCVQYFVGLNIS